MKFWNRIKQAAHELTNSELSASEGLAAAKAQIIYWKTDEWLKNYGDREFTRTRRDNSDK